MCLIWKHKDGHDSLTTEEKLELVRQFHTLNRSGILWLTGGEPLKKMDQCLKISSLCRELGLFVGTNSNGSYITDDSTAIRFLKNGPHSILISLDSHIQEIHNYTRGCSTAYHQTMDALQRLIQLRNKHFSKFENHIGLMCILFDENLPLFTEYVEFARKLGVDSVHFQILSNTFASEYKENDIFFEKHFFRDKRKARKNFETIYRRYRNDRFVKFLNFNFIKKYIDNPEFRTKYPMCHSHTRNMMVAINDEVQLCFNSNQILENPFIGNVRSQSLRQLWNSEEAQKARTFMNQCQRHCGLLNCHNKTTFFTDMKLSLFMKYSGFRKRRPLSQSN